MRICRRRTKLPGGLRQCVLAGLPPWLTPEGLAALAALAAQGVPEINGPETMRLPDDD